MEIKVEKMTTNDLENIKEVLISDFDNFWNYNILNQELLNDTSHIFVAKNKQQVIVGFASIQFILNEADITNIVTRKKYRNNGIGTMLLNKLISFSKQNNITKISLEVNKNNKYAIKLYNSFGFNKIGLRKKYYNNIDDAVIMSLKL